MDGAPFDALTRKITTHLNRRGSLALLLSLGVASLLAPAGAEASRRKKKKRKKKRRQRRNRQCCPRGMGGCGEDQRCCPPPAGTTPGESGIGGAVLGLIPPAAATGYRLQMTELVWEPGAYAASHTHPLAQVACVQSGALGMTIQEGATIVTRGGAGPVPASTEPLPLNTEVILWPRDCIAYDEFTTHTVHTAWNACKGTTVLWMADLVKNGEPYTTYVDAAGTPVS